MTCWDNCSNTWRAVGESTSCTRDINDGTVVTARLTVEITDIRYDTGCIEPCYHQFDAIVKIYQLYNGDAFETLVYENVDTFDYYTCKTYYKYNEWEVCFNDITESPAEVRTQTSHKALCPGCTHPYVCDCEDTIGWEDWSITYAPAATNNPDPETIYVKLLEIETGNESIRVEIKIYRDGIVVYTDPSAIINLDSYIDISDSSTEHDWRVACNNILPGYQVTLQLCFNFADSGEGSGSTGSGLLVAQYFDSTAFGWTGGCVIHCQVDNPKSGGGHNTAPTEIELNLYEWQGDYISTINSTSLTTCNVLTPCEILEDYFYVPFIWDIDVPPGEYIWTLGCLYGPHDGSFIVSYQAYDEYSLYPCWVNGYSHNAVTSRILGITPEESWEGILCADDTFYSGGFQGYGGHSNIKVNSGDNEYKNMLSSRVNCNCVKNGPGIMNIANPSFETGDHTGWQVSGSSGMGNSIITEWASDGIYSSKFFITNGSYVEYNDDLFIYQSFTYYPNWTMTFDKYVPTSDSKLKFEIYNCSYSETLVAGTYLNESVILTSNYLILKLLCRSDYPSTGSAVYIDNIRLTPPVMPDVPVGRIARNSSNVQLI